MYTTCPEWGYLCMVLAVCIYAVYVLIKYHHED
jgi:hypothetical protein